MAKIIDFPSVHPASCWSCGVSGDQGSRKWWLDTEKYAEDWGNVYWCDQCFMYLVYIATEANGQDIEVADEIMTLRRANTELNQKVGIYESVLRPLVDSNVLSLLAGAFNLSPQLLDHANKEPQQPQRQFVEAEREPEVSEPTSTETADGGLATVAEDFVLDVSGSTTGPVESFDDAQLGSLPIIASEFDGNAEPEKPFIIGQT